MEENRRIFGHMPDGTPVEEITLRSRSATCQIITYGGAVRSLKLPRLREEPLDVVLGFDTLEDYIAQDKYMGALVGRYANRIAGARFTLGGVEHSLAANDGPDSLHGGNVGFDKRVWTVEDLGQDYVTLSLVSPDGEEGYPGTLEVRVTYTLSGAYACDERGSLDIAYSAKCDKDTVFNPTSHIYFNLSGHASGSVEGQYIELDASRYTPVGPGLIPTGAIDPVDGAPMDLRKAQRIGAHIDDPFHQVRMAGGYDHNWAIDGWAEKGAGRQAAWAWSPDTGIAMSMSTDMPGVQFYTGDHLDGCPKGKGGAVYGKRCGFCLESQSFPDSPNQPGFPSCVLRAGEGYRSHTGYRFSVPFSYELAGRGIKERRDRMTDKEKKELMVTACKVRIGIIESTHAAKAGHPGGSLSAAELFTYLYFKELNVDPKDPKKWDRDRFVLSKGHCAPGMYAAMALRGFFPWEDLKTLRHIGSYLQGHPDMRSVPGVDMSTGSLGQGISAACGMALVAKQRHDPIRVYTLLGDGEIQEGQVWEAMMFAHHYGLDGLCAIIDNNGLQIDGPVEKVMSPYPIEDKLRAFGWEAVTVNGHDFDQLADAFAQARAVKGRPFAIVMRTTKGKGVSFMEDQADWHGKAPNDEQCEIALKELNAELARLEGM